MKYVYIGEIVNTHGLKGELRILSDFQYKSKVFTKGMKFYLGKRKQEMIVNTYRPHKNYDMVTLEGITDINDAIAFKGDSVYVNRNDIEIDGYVNEDIIGMEVYDRNNFLGVVENITNNTVQEILVIKDKTRRYLVPFISEFVKKVDLEDKRIDIEAIEGLLHDN